MTRVRQFRSFPLRENHREIVGYGERYALYDFAAAALFSTAVAAQTGSAEQALLQLERDWEQANVKNDLAALERILAPEFVSTDSDGRLFTRAEGFERRKSGQVSFTAFTQDEYKVHVVGDTAIVTGRYAAKGTQDGKPLNFNPLQGGIQRSFHLSGTCQPNHVSNSWNGTHAQVNGGAME